MSLRNLFIVCALAGVQCLGCSRSNSENSKESAGPATSPNDTTLPSWGPELDGVRMRISTSKSTFAPAEPIALTLELANDAQTDLATWPDDPNGDLQAYTVDMRTTTGFKPYNTEWGGLEQHQVQPRLIPSIIVNGGYSSTYTCKWLNRIFDMTRAATYVVSVRRRVVSPKDGKTIIEVTSNAINIIVTDDPPLVERFAKNGS
jgi:hypothetical protein